MRNSTQETRTSKIEFTQLGRCVVEGQYDGRSVTCDIGVIWLGVTDCKLGQVRAAANCIADGLAVKSQEVVS
jgi:hypothetical protein